MKREKLREQLASATGFQDPELIDHLVDGGFEPTTLAALALVPMVFVAWADGSVTPSERKTVMSLALKRGLDSEPMSLQMLETWLQKHPPRPLWKLWKEYAAALHETVSPTLSELLATEILAQATAVAEASGGTLGFGKVSNEEQKILDEIANIYS